VTSHPAARALQTAAQFILHADVCRALSADQPDLDRVRSLLEQARTKQINIFDAELAYVVKTTLERMMQKLMANPGDVKLLQYIGALAGFVRGTPLDLNLWKVQNGMGNVAVGFSRIKTKAGQADPGAIEWTKRFSRSASD
jgi:hypothetical protein